MPSSLKFASGGAITVMTLVAFLSIFYDCLWATVFCILAPIGSLPLLSFFKLSPVVGKLYSLQVDLSGKKLLLIRTNFTRLEAPRGPRSYRLHFGILGVVSEKSWAYHINLWNYWQCTKSWIWSASWYGLCSVKWFGRRKTGTNTSFFTWQLVTWDHLEF